jgi:hypothetical protein
VRLGEISNYIIVVGFALGTWQIGIIEKKLRVWLIYALGKELHFFTVQYTSWLERALSGMISGY